MKNTYVYIALLILGGVTMSAFFLLQNGRGNGQPAPSVLSGEANIETLHLADAVGENIVPADEVVVPRVEYADLEAAEKVMAALIDQDATWETDLRQYLEHPDQMPTDLYEELSSFASNPLQIKRMHVDLKLRASVIQVEIHKSSPEKEAEYEAEFREYVKEREAGYPEIAPESGMITVSNAVEIAAALYSGYDKTQTPKVELGKGVYTVTLWNHRRPMLSTSYFAAIIDIDAWSGEVVNVLLSAD